MYLEVFLCFKVLYSKEATPDVLKCLFRVSHSTHLGQKLGWDKSWVGA